MNEFLNYSFKTFISSIHSIAKMNPEYIDSMLTDFNLKMVLEDIDDKMYEAYNNYSKYKSLFLSTNKNDGGFYTLYKSNMERYYLELNTNYNLFLLYFKIMKERNLDFYIKSNIKEIERIYLSNEPTLLKRFKKRI